MLISELISELSEILERDGEMIVGIHHDDDLETETNIAGAIAVKRYFEPKYEQYISESLKESVFPNSDYGKTITVTILFSPIAEADERI